MQLVRIVNCILSPRFLLDFCLRCDCKCLTLGIKLFTLHSMLSVYCVCQECKIATLPKKQTTVISNELYRQFYRFLDHNKLYNNDLLLTYQIMNIIIVKYKSFCHLHS